MKKQTLMALTLAATTLIGTSAFAADGTITFTGEIKDATCDISTNSGTTAVVIPSLAKANLASNGAVGPNKNFSIELSGAGCSGTNSKVQVAFESVSGSIDPVTGLLVNATGAGASTGVALELVDKDGNTIPLNLASYRTLEEDISTANTATIPLSIRYKATSDTVVEGTVSTSVGVRVETF